MSLPQLSKLLPLPQGELEQVVDYASTLSKADAVEHFKNLLGDSPAAIEFISSFNARRQDPAPPRSQPPTIEAASSDISAVPKATRAPKKKKAPLHTPAPRQVTDFSLGPGIVYNKKNQEDEYISRRSSPAPAASSSRASPAQTPKSHTPPPPKNPPSAAGHLISDMPTRSKPKSNPVSRSSTPGPKTKVSISGGTAMHGASTAVSDLDAAIRALEMTTNPTQAVDVAVRRCNCVATRHPLQTAAPNCLSCGKVICVKEGLGPCTFCGTPLLGTIEVQAMIQELKAERGKERMAADREAHRRAEVSQKPRPFTKPREGADVSAAEIKALEHRDKLLNFQAQNAKRTTVRDEAADFDVSSAMTGTGGNMWSTPEERARELKRQQKILRELEWNARPEYEKRRQVVSIDLVKGKVVRKMTAIERSASPDSDDGASLGEAGKGVAQGPSFGGSRDGGAFSRNPLLGDLIKPIYNPEGKGSELEGRRDRRAKWRRVQDDLNDNEAIILDGGTYGTQSVAA